MAQDCAWGEYIRRDQAEVSFVLQAPRTAWVLQHVYGYAVTRTLGAPVSYTSEAVVCSQDLPAGEFYGLLMHQDAVGVASSVIVTGPGGATLVQGTDYRLQIVSGYTAIVGIIGGGLTRGDSIMVDYTVTPATQTQVDMGTSYAQPAHQWVVSEHGTGKHLTIDIPEAQVVSPVQISLDPKADRMTPVTLRARRGYTLLFDE